MYLLPSPWQFYKQNWFLEYLKWIWLWSPISCPPRVLCWQLRHHIGELQNESWFKLTFSLKIKRPPLYRIFLATSNTTIIYNTSQITHIQNSPIPRICQWKTSKLTFSIYTFYYLYNNLHKWILFLFLAQPSPVNHFPGLWNCFDIECNKWPNLNQIPKSKSSYIDE